MTGHAFRKIYYGIKPLIPRRFQIFLRRRMVKRLLPKVTNFWPIDPDASKSPPNWHGWPGGKKFALVLTHDVDTARGQAKAEKLAHLEMELGFRSSFNFVPERYQVSAKLREYLANNGFEVGVHGLKHDGKLYQSEKIFKARATKINQYLQAWHATGFRSPAMHHNLEWLGQLNIEYDSSTFDTDPFEPQSDGVGTIFPFWVDYDHARQGYVELPYTLAQDFTLFILLQKKDIEIWQRKLDWIAAKGGMASVNVHPDYMSFDGSKSGFEEFPAKYYEEFLRHVKEHLSGEYWSALPREVAQFCKNEFKKTEIVENRCSPLASQAGLVMHTSKYKVGNRVKVRSREEIQQTLHYPNHLDGCLFMNQMWNYCGKEYRIIKVVEHVFDEYELKMYNCLAPSYLLENVICDGNIDPFEHKCDRSCYILWQEMWLKKIEE